MSARTPSPGTVHLHEWAEASAWLMRDARVKGDLKQASDYATTTMALLWAARGEGWRKVHELADLTEYGLRKLKRLEVLKVDPGEQQVRKLVDVLRTFLEQ